MATAMEGSMPSQHGNGETIPPLNGNTPAVTGIPSFEGQTGMNGNNALPASGVPEHGRTPSFTITPSGINGAPPVGQPNKANNIQFGAIGVGGQPISPAQASSSPANLGVGGVVNPRMVSPQASPSPVPRPAVSGGRPPSGLQNQGNPLVFGQPGPETNDPNVSR